MIFYIGYLALDFPDLPEDMELSRADEAFLQQHLPVTKQITVRIRPTASLRIPDSAFDVDPWLKTWEEAEQSCRAYRDGYGLPSDRSGFFCVSRRSGDSIVIEVADAYMDIFRAHFRPWFSIHLEEFCLENDALIFHSSNVICQGKSILFTRPGTTERADQLDLWHPYLNRATDETADLSILQKTGRGWFSCNFPASDGILRGTQKPTPLEAIVILERGAGNHIEELTISDKLSLLCTEATIPSTKKHGPLAVDLLLDLVRDVHVLRYTCDLKENAIPFLLEHLGIGQEAEVSA